MDAEQYEAILRRHAIEINNLTKANGVLLTVCKLVEAALAVGNGINRRSQPIGGKTYISQLKAAIAVATR